MTVPFSNQVQVPSSTPPSSEVTVALHVPSSRVTQRDPIGRFGQLLMPTSSVQLARQPTATCLVGTPSHDKVLEVAVHVFPKRSYRQRPLKQLGWRKISPPQNQKLPTRQ